MDNTQKNKVDTIIEKYRNTEKSESIEEKIEKLDKKAEAPGQIFSLVIGIAGALIFGTGLSLVLAFNNTVAGIIVAAAGAAVAAFAYPVYKKMTANGREKYGKEILELSKQL